MPLSADHRHPCSAVTSRVNSLSVALRAGYLSVRTAEGASEKQSSLKARLRNGLTYLLTYYTRAKPCVMFGCITGLRSIVPMLSCVTDVGSVDCTCMM